VDFYARQEAARRTTRWLLLAFLVCVALVVLTVDAIVFALFSASDAGGPSAGVLVFTTIVVLAIICGASLFKTLTLRAGGAVVARSLGGIRVDRNTRDPALRRLVNVVEEMSIASGVTMPEVYVLENEDGINAFAAGNSPADAAVAVTRGAATQLRRDELQGVIAHEFSHILNGDMRLNLRLLGWIFGLLVIAIVARIVLQGSSTGRNRRDGAGALILAALAVMVLGYIGVFFGRLLQAAVSRHRERLADASAVQFTRDPSGLTGALLKIAGAKSGSRLVNPEAEEVAHMLFAAGLPRMFATHPTLEERLKSLNPAFRASELPALAATAARDAQRLRQSDIAAMTIATQPPAADVAPAALPARHAAFAGDAAVIAAQAGTIATDQVRYAERVRASIPESLREFIDSADHARNLMFALLASRVPQVESRQRQILEAAYGPEINQRVFDQRAVADSLAPALRLPAVQQLFPALRRLSLAERQKLREVVNELALADARIDVFECCLTLLLASSLYDELEAGAQHGSASLLQEADAINVLFCVLAAQGAPQREVALSAYQAGISAVLPQHRPDFRDLADWPAALRDALARLVHLRPFAKRLLIEGMVRCVAHDRRLSVEEGELLRTVCAVLHCPLPPILGRPPDSS
jgi:Zn-dependent protease with chaperone function